MKNRIFNIITLVSVITVLIGCKKDADIVTPLKNNPLSGLVKLKEGYAVGAGAKVQIWGAKNFFVGYNKLTVVLLDSVNEKDTIKDAHIHFNPLMTMTSMGGMQHNCPIENPDEESVNGVFSGALVFIMSSSTTDTWDLSLSVHNHTNGKYGTALFKSITVDTPTTAVMTSFTTVAPDSSKLFLSLVSPSSPKVGINDIEFTIHKKMSMMSFPADSSYTIEFVPEMPSMGHSSDNNVNPTHLGNGHYKGKVNFSMTGEWKINVTVKKNGAILSNGLSFTKIIQ